VPRGVAGLAGPRATLVCSVTGARKRELHRGMGAMDLGSLGGIVKSLAPSIPGDTHGGMLSL